MITKWLHLDERNGDPWVLPIWVAVNKQIEAKRLPQIPNELTELAIHISTRLNVLPRIVERINHGTKAVYEETRKYNDAHVCSSDAEGYALPINDNLKYNLIADIDAFLYELNACSDQMKVFFSWVHNFAGKGIEERNVASEFQSALVNHGASKDWFRALDNHRNFFAHCGTPYPAVDISGSHPELIVMKENLKQFDDTTKFFKLSELNEIANGFGVAKHALQAHLVTLF